MGEYPIVPKPYPLCALCAILANDAFLYFNLTQGNTIQTTPALRATPPFSHFVRVVGEMSLHSESHYMLSLPHHFVL
jgi:hypothetical protein